MRAVFIHHQSFFGVADLHEVVLEVCHVGIVLAEGGLVGHGIDVHSTYRHTLDGDTAAGEVGFLELFVDDRFVLREYQYAQGVYLLFSGLVLLVRGVRGTYIGHWYVQGNGGCASVGYPFVHSVRAAGQQAGSPCEGGWQKQGERMR